MLSKNLEFVVNNIGLSVEGATAFGIYGGYLISVYENGNKKTVFINFLLESNDDNSLTILDISEAIKENLEKFKIFDYKLEEDGLHITSTGDVAVFQNMLDFCIDLIKEYDVMGSGYCSSCGKEFGRKYPKKITRGNDGFLMCDRCSLELMENNNKKAAQRKIISQSEKIKGFFGALAGGVIGYALYFAVYFWIYPILQLKFEDGFDFRYIICMIGLLTAIFSYNGYRLFCPKVNTGAYISVSVCSVVFTVLGQYTATIINILSDNGIGFFKIREYGRLFLMPLRNKNAEGYVNYSASFYLLVTVSLLFAIVGAVILLMGFYEKSKNAREEIIIETMKIKNG